MTEPAAPDPVPLYVDLDGTLVHTDVSIEQAFALVKRHLSHVLLLPLWLLRGRAYLKRRIAADAALDPAALPYEPAVLEYLAAEKRRGRRLVLATAADVGFARQVADHLGLFDAVIGSDGGDDLAGATKLARIAADAPDGVFDYAGDDLPDLVIFRHARRALVINPAPALRGPARRLENVAWTLDTGARHVSAYVLGLRPWRWLWALLVWLPLLVAPVGTERIAGDGIAVLVAFVALASGCHLFDDLVNLGARRALPRRCQAPLVRDELPLSRAAAGILLCFVVALAALAVLPAAVGLVALAHLALAVAAAVWLDDSRGGLIVAAGGLGATRVAAGALAVGLPVDMPLLAIGAAVGVALELLRRCRDGPV